MTLLKYTHTGRLRGRGGGPSMCTTQIQGYLFGVVKMRSPSGRQIHTDTAVMKGVTRPLKIEQEAKLN